MPSRTRFLLALVVLCAAARADTLVLENGDRITGKKLTEQNGVIEFQSDALGLLVLPVARVRLERPAPSDTDDAPVAKKPPTPQTGDFKPIDLRTAARSPKRALKAEPTGWRNFVEFGLTSQSGLNDKSDLAVRYESDRRGTTTESRLLARYLYGETEGAPTTDLVDASLRLRKNLSPVLFAQSISSYGRDSIKGIANEADQGFGLGRNVRDRDGVVIALGAGASGRYREEISEAGEIAYTIDAFQDLSYSFNDRFSLNQDLSMVVAPANSDDYRLKFNAALVGKVTSAVNLSIRYEMQYDRALQPEARDSQRIVSALGYTF